MQEFDARTGCGILVNTSFNVRGEPIVCTSADAYRCFMRTEMDYLVIENFLLDKRDQPTWNETQAWQEEFESALMATPHDIPELDRKGLRNFVLTMGIVVAILFGLIMPWLLARQIELWNWPDSWPWVFFTVAAAWDLLHR